MHDASSHLSPMSPSPGADTRAAGDFNALGLAAPLLTAVRQAGYRQPTPIQAAAIPLLLRGGDLIGCARTGTGKTAAFALPILHQLLAASGHRPPRIRALVLAPTRELAAQIDDSFRTLSAGTGLRSTVVFGGVKKGPQIRALANRPAVLVATPGRLLDLLSERALSLAEVQYAVLDEADRMLDMGFLPDVRRILACLPTRRQTLLFSATMPPAIAQLAAQFLHRPQRVEVEPPAESRHPIEQCVHFVEKAAKADLLVRTLRDSGQALIFTRTKHGANKLVRQLGNAGIRAAAIHGNKSQSAREAALADFKSGRTRIVVATDLASRGIDIVELPLVINYELPNEPEVYVHRIGRTGRAGATGKALSFCSREELPFLQSIEKLTRQRIPRAGSEPQPAAVAAASTAHAQDATPAARERTRRRTRRRSINSRRGAGASCREPATSASAATRARR